jgi:hypothetical protein
MVEYVPLPFFLHNAVDLELCLKVASLALPAATTPAAAFGQPGDDSNTFSLADKLAAQGELLVTAQVSECTHDTASLESCVTSLQYSYVSLVYCTCTFLAPAGVQHGAANALGATVLAHTELL